MPEYSRVEARRRGRRRQRTSALLVAIVGVVAVVAIAGLGVFWFLSASRGHSAAPQPAAQQGSGASGSSLASVKPAKGADATASTTVGGSGAAGADPAVLEAARLSVEAAQKAAVKYPGAPAVDPSARTISHLAPRHKYVAITLDDGYNFQPAMLELFKQYDVHCTTFLIGSWAAANKADLQAVMDAGFEVGNHSWSHPFLTTLSSAAIANELTKTQRVISSVTGVQAPYLRPPYGATNPTVKAAAARLGYRIVLWDRSLGDSSKATSRLIVRDMLAQPLQPGDIILCHWGSKASYKALKKLLPTWRKQGFQFVTVSELIADSQ